MRNLLVLAVIGISLVSGLQPAFSETRPPPPYVGFTTRSDPTTPSVMRLEINGKIEQAGSVRGNTEGGVGILYGPDNKLHIRLTWYDIIEDVTRDATVEIDAYDVPTFGDYGTTAHLTFTYGPGADVSIHTLNLQVMTLIGQRRIDELLALPKDNDRLDLALLCGKRLPATDPLAINLKEWTAHDMHLGNALALRETVLARGERPAPRCKE